MGVSHFNDSINLESNKVIITVLEKKERYYVVAEGKIKNEPFIKLLTRYENYFLNLSKERVENLKLLSTKQTIFISFDQFNAVANHTLNLKKELANCLRSRFNEEEKESILKKFQTAVVQKNKNNISSLHFKEKKQRYLILTALDAIREGLDWATMPLLLFWIPISFTHLAFFTLILLITVTAVVTLAVASYTIYKQYNEDKKELSRLTKNSIDNPLELPQIQQLSYLKDMALPALVTATTLFSFFWVTYDILVALAIISSTSLPILPLIAIPVCLVVSLFIGGVHFYKLNLENQLYQEICEEKNITGEEVNEPLPSFPQNDSFLFSSNMINSPLKDMPENPATFSTSLSTNSMT